MYSLCGAKLLQKWIDSAAAKGRMMNAVHDKKLRDVYDILLQAAVFSDVGATVAEIAEALDQTETTVYAKLKSIPEEHMIQHRSSRPYHYMLCLDAFA